MTEPSTHRGPELEETSQGSAPVPDDTLVGDDDVDTAVDRLGELDRLPLEEQVVVYEDIQDRLARVLERDSDLGGPER
jgi:hypothetical protein